MRQVIDPTDLHSRLDRHLTRRDLLHLHELLAQTGANARGAEAPLKTVSHCEPLRVNIRSRPHRLDETRRRYLCVAHGHAAHWVSRIFAPIWARAAA